jgi:hypothetical protein
MSKNFILLILIVLHVFAFGQTNNASIGKGTITLITNQKFTFSNLRYVDDQVVFTNVGTGSEFTYFLHSVKIIEDENKTVIYTKKPDVIKPREAVSEEIAETEEDFGFKADYPEGIYKTKEDFINKKPNEIKHLTPKGLIGFTKPTLRKPEQNCFFYDTETDEKVKNVFAISYKGGLYFQISAILDNRNKTDRAQTNSFPNSFVRVITGGKSYFYTEAELANAWAQGVAYGGVGGAAGAVLAADMVNGKGIVWDFKNNEFNIFKNCKDYNEFIKDKYPEGIQECKNQQADIRQIRTAIEKIK